MKEYILENIEVLNNLILLDNKIESSKLKKEDFIKYSNISTSYKFNNALIIYDGNPFITLKLLNSDIKNSVFYPNGSCLGVNRFLTNYKDDIKLSYDKNDFLYEKIQDKFDYIIVVNENIEELSKIYKNVIYIEI
jgi:hypothetical protein